MHRTDHAERQNTPQIGTDEIPSGGFGARQHHRETHPKQQRKYGPEFSLHKVGDKPACEPVESGETDRHTFADAIHGPTEEFDVHQEYPDQRESAYDIQCFDPFAA